MPGMTAHGLVSPDEARRQLELERKERIERVKRIKNREAKKAADRVAPILAKLGLSRADRKNLGKRQRKGEYKRVENFRWSPD